MYEHVAQFILAQATTVPPTEPAPVGIPWGSWVVSALNVAQPLVLLALSGVTTYVMGAFVPGWMRAFAGDAVQRRINQVLEHAVLSAIAQTKDAVAGKRVTIPIASEILTRAAQYAVDQAPDLVSAAAKGQASNLSKMILARMEKLGVAPDDFDVSTIHTTFPVDVTKQFGK